MVWTRLEDYLLYNPVVPSCESSKAYLCWSGFCWSPVPLVVSGWLDGHVAQNHHGHGHCFVAVYGTTDGRFASASTDPLHSVWQVLFSLNIDPGHSLKNSG